MERADPASLAALGFAVFPIAAMKKAPPLWKNWPERASTTVNPAEWPDGCNVGIHCAGLLVVDVDTAKGGDESYAKLDVLEGFPDTRWSSTPSGGRHVFYKLPASHGGVPNSVAQLGAGLDIRSAGGYVVAPGSRTDRGSYSWGNDLPVADAPDWLVLRLGTVVPKTATPAAPVPDAPDAIFSRAADWISKQEGALEGAGGDARTFAVACGLRDLGVSQAQAVALMDQYWNNRCSPPWSLPELEAKARNAYAYGQNAPGTRSAQADDFPIAIPDNGALSVAPMDTSGKHVAKPRVLRLVEFSANAEKGAGYVVKGLLQRRSYAEIYGAPGAGKTFVALDLAYHVAAGKAWMDRLVHTGPVLYLAYEGTGGLVKRAQALRQKYGEADVPLYICGAAFNLREQGGRRALGEAMSVMPEKPVLIVIDTFARALMGGDENSAQDVGAFNTAIASLIESTGACVTIIHHSGKDKTKGARGSSALLGALDTEIEVDMGQVIARKQRDVEAGDPIGFKLTPVVVGVDDDGDEQTSCVVYPEKLDAVLGAERLTGNPKRGFDVLCAMSPNNRPVDPLAWRDACGEFLEGKAVNQRFFDLKKTLVKKGIIETLPNGSVHRRLS